MVEFLRKFFSVKTGSVYFRVLLATNAFTMTFLAQPPLISKSINYQKNLELVKILQQ